VAMEYPELFAVRYGKCERCGRFFCDGCILSNQGKCPNCNRDIEIIGPHPEESGKRQEMPGLKKRKRTGKKSGSGKNAAGKTKTKEREPGDVPKVRSLYFNGLGSWAKDAHLIFPKLKDLLIPSVSNLTGRDPDVVREEIRGPEISSISRVRGECLFDDNGISCEIRLYEGLFLALRCFAEILATQMAVPQDEISMVDIMSGAAKLSVSTETSIPREKAVELMEAVLERFWQKPDDPLGVMDLVDKARMFRPGYVQPIAEVLSSLKSGLEDPRRAEAAQMLVLSGSLFIMAHELGHYVTKAKMDPNALARMADAVREVGFDVPESMSDEWAMNWADEFQADLEAVNILMDFGQRLAENKIEIVQHKKNYDAFIVNYTIESYSNIFFTLGCFHLIETYGWARFGKPYLVPSHPQPLRRRELVVRTIPPQAVIQLTWAGELVWREMETLFSEVLSRLDEKKRFYLTGSEKKELLEYFASSQKRFQENYINGNIFKEVKELHEQLGRKS
jgi:hypothetical protein